MKYLNFDEFKRWKKCNFISWKLVLFSIDMCLQLIWTKTIVPIINKIIQRNGPKQLLSQWMGIHLFFSAILSFSQESPILFKSIEHTQMKTSVNISNFIWRWTITNQKWYTKIVNNPIKTIVDCSISLIWRTMKNLAGQNKRTK